MTRSVIFRVHCFLAIALSILVANSQVRAEELYPFVALQVGNSSDNNMCLGLARAIECLEEGTAVEGIETSVDLARRLSNVLTDSEDDEFVYYSALQLRDGTNVPTRSKAAISEVGFLIQQEYTEMMKTRLSTEVVKHADPSTPEGRALLKAWQKYLDLFNKEQENRITSEEELKRLIRDEDKDGLLAVSGQGRRLFENGPPKKIIDKFNLRFDSTIGGYPSVVPSAHAFLLTYDEDERQFYVYDSDDPDGKWPVVVEGRGVCQVRDNRAHECTGFRIRWRLDDHMGNGPTEQMYYDVRPLDDYLTDIRDILDGASRDAKITHAKVIEP